MQVTIDWKERKRLLSRIHKPNCINSYLSKWCLKHYNPPYTPLITDDCICNKKLNPTGVGL